MFEAGGTKTCTEVLGREKDGVYCGSQVAFKMTECPAQEWNGGGRREVRNKAAYKSRDFIFVNYTEGM